MARCAGMLLYFQQWLATGNFKPQGVFCFSTTERYVLKNNFSACCEGKHSQEANISSIGTECTHLGPVESEKIASQGVLPYGLGIGNPLTSQA